jgi:hypothetical protein
LKYFSHTKNSPIKLKLKMRKKKIFFKILILIQIFTFVLCTKEYLLFIENSLTNNIPSNISLLEISKENPPRPIIIKRIYQGLFMGVCYSTNFNSFFYMEHTNELLKIQLNRYPLNFTKEIYLDLEFDYNHMYLLSCDHNQIFWLESKNHIRNLYKFDIFQNTKSRVNVNFRDNQVIETFQIYENEIYFLINGLEIYKVKINGGSPKLLFKEEFGNIISFRIFNKFLYYSTHVFTVEYELSSGHSRTIFFNHERRYLYRDITLSLTHVYISTSLIQTKIAAISSIDIETSEFKNIIIRNDSSIDFINFIYRDDTICREECFVFGGLCDKEVCKCFKGKKYSYKYFKGKKYSYKFRLEWK